MRILRYLWIFGFIAAASLQAEAKYPEPDWTEGVPVPLDGRGNIYQIPGDKLDDVTMRGKRHALNYPVTVTGLLLPYQGLKQFLESPQDNPLRALLKNLFGATSGFRSVDDLESWLGLYSYPDTIEQNIDSVESIPLPVSGNIHGRMGSSLVENGGTIGLTYSCGACHVGNLFGTKVIGMPTRFPRANVSFKLGKLAARSVPSDLVASILGSDKEERQQLKRLRTNIAATDGRYPLVLGLDTSLAHTALSLSRRNKDEYAAKSRLREVFPRRDWLRSNPSDSKPGTWWLVKYKNRWLSDGSIVSGNPIFTNFLWNEIGRGTDLGELEVWLEENADLVQELTAAVFQNKAPRYTDFFPAEDIDLKSAKRGEQIFKGNCAGCHGTYEKAWSLAEFQSDSLKDLLKTTKVSYHRQTPVIDVGTDPLRYQGMASLEQLNDLKISQSFGTVVKKQKGYVPQPLVGIWARWPYFHNNSAPSLCAVLTRAEDRPKTYQPVEAHDRDRDFDKDCNGYPLDQNRPRDRDSFFDTSIPGLGNQGHDEGIFLDNGKERLSPADKKDLIMFLKTL